MSRIKKIWARKVYLLIPLAAVIVGFIVYIWCLYSGGNEVSINSDNFVIWCVISGLICFVLLFFVYFIIEREKSMKERDNTQRAIHELFSDLTSNIVDMEDNNVKMHRETYDRITDILKLIDVKGKSPDGV